VEPATSLIPPLSVLVAYAAMGFAFAAPIGPIGLLSMNRTLTHGYKAGLMTGLGCVLADTVLATVALLGLEQVSHLLAPWQGPLEAVTGGIFVGLGLWLAIPRRPTQPPPGRAHVGDIGAGFFLTLFNPANLLGFLAAFAALNTTAHIGSALGLVALVGAVSVGAFAAWGVAMAAPLFARHITTDDILLRLGRYAGGMVALFGATLLVRAVL
jgi:putative LysE/RhtB family amino acid efflux pump